MKKEKGDKKMDEIYVGMQLTASLYELFIERYEAGDGDGDTVHLTYSRIVWSGDGSYPQPADYYDLYDATGTRHLFGMDGETVEVTGYDGDVVTFVFEDDVLHAEVEMTDEEFRICTGLE